jgi:hypothetical protein
MRGCIRWYKYYAVLLWIRNVGKQVSAQAVLRVSTKFGWPKYLWVPAPSGPTEVYQIRRRLFSSHRSRSPSCGNRGTTSLLNSTNNETQTTVALQASELESPILRIVRVLLLCLQLDDYDQIVRLRHVLEFHSLEKSRTFCNLSFPTTALIS